MARIAGVNIPLNKRVEIGLTYIYGVGRPTSNEILAKLGIEPDRYVRDLTDGVGADAVLECVGTDEAMSQAIRCTRAGGGVGFVGVPHGVEISGRTLFSTMVRLHGGPAPVRRFLPDLIQQIWDREIDPGKVFDLTLPLDQAAEGYKAMDERRATKVLLTVD